ncbi:MAG TPA: hypothetical protein VHD63_04525 [Ktedonobacteraceae bacterium]|nr:hypothetical protein [Ktedonobacteraceae bacterium]
MFELAHTAWPRFGGDRAHRSLLRIPALHVPPTWLRIALPLSPGIDPAEASPGGAIVASDEILRVVHAGVLSAIRLDGALLWQLDLARFVPRKWRWEGFCSLPIALSNGETLIYLPNALLIVNHTGQARQLRHLFAFEQSQKPIADGLSLSDPETSPNLTYSGWLLSSNACGEVYVFKTNHWQKCGSYGYDITMPAVYQDDSLAIAGYYNSGFCRVNLDGSLRWRTNLNEADLIPTLNYDEVAAVGALNTGCSAFFAPDGQQIGEYPYPATFAVYPDGGWIARSKQRLARLTPAGQEIWACDVPAGKSPSSFVEQPLVDSTGFSFTRQPEGFLCCDPQGHPAFEIRWPGSEPGFLSIVAPGTIACIVEHELLIGHA